MFRSLIKTVKQKILSIWRIADEVSREKALEVVDAELEELENIFGILVLGSYVGFPSPPMQISLDLMPFMEKELILMTEKVDNAYEPLSNLFSIFSID
jgi:hypothetical protein